MFKYEATFLCLSQLILIYSLVRIIYDIVVCEKRTHIRPSRSRRLWTYRPKNNVDPILFLYVHLSRLFIQSIFTLFGYIKKFKFDNAPEACYLRFHYLAQFIDRPRIVLYFDFHVFFFFLNYLFLLKTLRR